MNAEAELFQLQNDGYYQFGKRRQDLSLSPGQPASITALFTDPWVNQPHAWIGLNSDDELHGYFDFSINQNPGNRVKSGLGLAPLTREHTQLVFAHVAKNAFWTGAAIVNPIPLETC